MLTPFTSTGEVDKAWFLKNLNAQIAAGASGIVVGGSLGEASTLSLEELALLVRITKEAVPESVPVVSGIAASSTKSALETLHSITDAGADGIMLLPPMRYKATDKEMEVFFSTIADSTGLSIMIYNNPIDYKNGVSIRLFETLLKKTNIEAVKESTRDVSNVIRLKNAFGDRLSVMTGVDTLAMESLLLGADGWVAGLVDAFPEETMLLYDLVKNEKIDKARKLYKWFMPLLELDIDPQLVQNIKLAACITGLSTETVRPPRLELSGTKRSEVLQIIQTAIENKPNISD